MLPLLFRAGQEEGEGSVEAGGQGVHNSVLAGCENQAAGGCHARRRRAAFHQPAASAAGKVVSL